MHKILFALAILAVSSLTSALPKCPPPGSANFLLPHETDCSEFYICAHGTPVLRSCPGGTHFNPIFMVCQDPAFAGCHSQLPCTWPYSIILRPHPYSCGKYYVCENGTPVARNCPRGLEFNARLQRCVWPHQSNCSISQACRSGVLSRHEDCGKYYICVHGDNVAMDCPSGLQWSTKLKECNWPLDSDCGIQELSDILQDDGESDGSQVAE